MRYLRFLLVPLACCAGGLGIVLCVHGLEAARITLVLLLLSLGDSLRQRGGLRRTP